MGFVAACEVFHWSDFNRGPVVPPGEGQPGMNPASYITVASSSASSSSTPASAAYTTLPAAPGNNAEGRRLLASTNGCVRVSSRVYDSRVCARSAWQVRQRAALVTTGCHFLRALISQGLGP